MGQEPAKDDWQSDALRVGLGDGDIKRLDANRILITNKTYKQVLVPYLTSSLPLFVTSDSLLNAYHVLYEESVRRMEQANARRLPAILRFVVRACRWQRHPPKAIRSWWPLRKSGP
jgi:hypothetical protein